jgi:hypothetical protein
MALIACLAIGMAAVRSNSGYAVVSPKNYTPGLSIRSVSVPPAPYDGS